MRSIPLITRVALAVIVAAASLTIAVSLHGISASPAQARDVIARINGARAGQTVVVPAGTFTGNVVIHSGVTVRGAGMNRSWIRGAVVYGSGCVISDVKLGRAGSSTRNGPDASHTLLRRVRFVGGGQSGGSWPNNAVLIIGSRFSCDHITFRSCVVERNVGRDPDFSKGFNNISLVERAGVHVDTILFDHCRVAGAPRMGMECFVKEGSGIRRGFQGITLRGCRFGASDAQTLDFSDQPEARASGILIEGCTIAGGGVTRIKWGYGICLEMPLDVTIRGNHFTRALTQSLSITDRDASRYSGPGAQITGNTFDLTTGVASGGGEAICLTGTGNRFTGNTIKGGWGANAVGLWDAAGNVVTGNTFIHPNGASAVLQHAGCFGNTVSPNLVQ